MYCLTVECINKYTRYTRCVRTLVHVGVNRGLYCMICRRTVPEIEDISSLRACEPFTYEGKRRLLFLYFYTNGLSCIRATHTADWYEYAYIIDHLHVYPGVYTPEKSTYHKVVEYYNK